MKNKLFKKILILSLACFTTLLIGCGKNKTSQIEKIKQKGTIVLGTCADYPPYEFHKNINGNDTIVGCDIEIAKEIANRLDVKLEIKDMKFGGLLAALDSKKVDFIIAGMNPSPKRAKSVDFSKVYYTSKQGIIVKKGTKEKYKSLNDFKGMTVGAQKGALQQKIAESIPNANVKLLSKITDLVLALNAGKVEAVVMEKPVAQSYAKTNKNIEVCDMNVEAEGVQGTAIAAKKGSPELIKLINKTIDDLNSQDKINKFIVNANKLAEEK